MQLEEIVDLILINAEKGASILYLMDDLQTALDERRQTLDLERDFLDSMYEAVEDSEWIPPEYYTNDWVSDVCRFLRTGQGAFDEQTR